MTSKKLNLLVTAAFFVALDVIVTRFLSFEIPMPPFGPVRFDFQIVVAALCGYALGPMWAMLSLVASDLLGVMLNSGSLGIFLGFTLSAAVRGLMFGLLLHKKQINIGRLIVAVSAVYITTDVFLSTLWLSIMLSSPYLPMLIARLVPKAILLATELAASIGAIKLFNLIEKRSSTKGFL